MRIKPIRLKFNFGFKWAVSDVFIQLLLIMWFLLEKIGFVRSLYTKKPILKTYSDYLNWNWIEQERKNWTDINILQERYDNLIKYSDKK